MPDTKADYSSISEMLEELCSTQIIPVGALGKMYSVVDKLRASQELLERTKLAENISVAILRLELSCRKHDTPAEASIRDDLQSLAAAWSAMDTDYEDMQTSEVKYDDTLELDAV